MILTPWVAPVTLPPRFVFPTCLSETGCVSRSAPTVVAPLPLRKNFGWNFLANVIYVAARSVTLIVLAKLGSTEMIGALLLAQAMINPILSIADLGLRTALITDARHEYLFRDYFGLRLLTALLILPTATLLAFLLGYEPQIVFLVIAVALGRFFESLSDIIHGLFQQHERLDWAARSVLIREPAIVVWLALGVGFTGNLLLGVAGLPVIAGLILIGCDLRKARQILPSSGRSASSARVSTGTPDGLRPSWDFRKMLALARLAAPAGIVLVIISLIPNLPRYVIESSLGMHALGVFGAIYAIASAPTQLVVALGNTIAPRLAKQYATGNLRAFCRLGTGQMIILAGMGLAGVLAAALLAPTVLALLYDSEIATYTSLAVYLTITAAILNFNTPLHKSLDAMRCFWTHVGVRLFALLILLVLLPGFVSTWGLEGAAWAMIASALGTTVAYFATVGFWLLHAPQPASSTTPLLPTTLAAVNAPNARHDANFKVVPQPVLGQEREIRESA